MVEFPKLIFGVVFLSIGVVFWSQVMVCAMFWGVKTAQPELLLLPCTNIARRRS